MAQMVQDTSVRPWFQSAIPYHKKQNLGEDYMGIICIFFAYFVNLNFFRMKNFKKSSKISVIFGAYFSYCKCPKQVC
jgi:hypothetical protein